MLREKGVVMNLTVRQVADRLGVALSTAYLLVRKNRIAHLRIGGKRGAIRVPADALEAFIRSALVQVKTDENGY